MAIGNAQSAPFTALRMPSTVTRAATTSVVKITGLRINPTGLSLTTASRAARASNVGSNKDIVSAVCAMIRYFLFGRSVSLAGKHFVMLGKWPQ